MLHPPDEFAQGLAAFNIFVRADQIAHQTRIVYVFVAEFIVKNTQSRKHQIDQIPSERQ